MLRKSSRFCWPNLFALALPLFVGACASPGQIGSATSAAQSSFAALSKGPPLLGWSSWSSTWTGRPQANEAYFKAQADVMADKLKSSGYLYINLDSGWDQGFDEHGLPLPNLRKFPNGILALADYVHTRGLKLGIYMEPGLRVSIYDANGTIVGTDIHFKDIADITQQGSTQGKGNEKAYRIDYSKPGAVEYVQSYANLLASWGVDYIKMDFVGPGGGNVKADNREDMKQWHAALKKNGRPIWLELSNYMSRDSADVWKATANGWRIENDIESYGRNGTPKLTIWSKVAVRFNDAPKWTTVAGPGGWNDLDSVEIGNGDSDGITPDERRSVMTLWAINCSPLILGADLTKLDDGDLAILTNPEVLAIDQAGHLAAPFTPGTDQQVWRVKNPDGSYTVAFFNLGKEPAKVSVQWSDLGINGSASVHDAWTHQDLGKFDSGYSATLATHACMLLKVNP